ncbi:undecaprenyl-diphosphate phosphatase [candidate division TA06 bacterium]|nr:undecaprenyl-diphosphate phosphatase [candidate division TA06 bacterium]
MSYLKAAALGILQGLTEFLPVSSSAHLLFIEGLLGINPPGIAFEVALHFGTALAVLIVFRKRIAGIFLSLFHLSSRKRDGEDPNFRLLLLLLIGSLPAGFLGFTFRSLVKEIFDSPQANLWASSALLVTGCFLFLTRFSPSITGSRKMKKGIGFQDALKMGIAQAAAILPGLSRSGLTIATGFFLGLKREEVVEFSFLLALPAIFGAVGIEFVGGLNGLNLLNPQNPLMIPLLIGTFFAFAFGLLALKVLLSIVQRGKLDRFAYYCWGVGVLGILLSI